MSSLAVAQSLVSLVSRLLAVLLLLCVHVRTCERGWVRVGVGQDSVVHERRQVDADQEWSRDRLCLLRRSPPLRDPQVPLVYGVCVHGDEGTGLGE